ncbi:MAG TPA: GxxExxY protein [Pyrinomonadaceae bacterium]|jgi:GxxExxY protein|nr:GxxExxY protein [Pyrinomonadaceae bacterium]
MIHQELTGKIIEACFEVSNELGIGYIESVYENALFIALQQKGVAALRQVPLKVKFRGAIVGDFKADMLVENKVLIELKAAGNLVNEHYAQILNYLKTTGIEVGLIVNFGATKLQYRRFDNKFNQKALDMDEALRYLING